VVLAAEATPKLILQLMDVRGLTIAHVKSHLQVSPFLHHTLLLQTQYRSTMYHNDRHESDQRVLLLEASKN
jgi:hypothetical protein